MPRYALIKNDSIVEFRNYPTKPDDIPHKDVKWLPCTSGSVPAYDPSTEKVTGPSYTINETDVTETWTKVSLTAQEISDLKENAVDVYINGSSWEVLAKVLLNHENRLRALESKSTITLSQFKTGVKALL